MHISIAIGRNVGDEPMSDEQWKAYNEGIERIIRDARGTVEVHEWGTSAYRTEDDYVDHYEPFGRYWAKVDDNHVMDIRRAIRALAGENGQWGIAFSFVATEMIQP